MILAALLIAVPLVSSNGYGTLQYNLSEARFDRFLQHPYKYENENVATRDLLDDASFKVDGVPLTGAAVSSFGYATGTGVMTIAQSVGDLAVTTSAFAPRKLGGASFVLVLTVRNDGAARVVPVVSTLRTRLGEQRPEPSGAGAFVRPVAAGLEQYGPYQHSAAVACIKTLPKGASNYSAETSGDDLAPTTTWSLSLAHGESRSVALLVSYDHGNTAADAWGRLDDWLAAESDPAALVVREQQAWESLDLPAAMSAQESSLYLQSLATIKMAQVQESDRAHGQILATLAASTSAEYNQWNITWVRDMAYATAALAEAGAQKEARDALAFQLQAQSGNYQDYVGKPYQISVCRYFGNGREESDSDQNGPNVEFDGFGLFLWSLGRYYAVSEDDAFVKLYWPLIKGQIADIIVSLVDPYSGLMRADSSIWEVHWKGKQRQFAYTSITAAAGLCAAGDLAQAVGDKDNARIYRNAAKRLRKAILEQLVGSDGVIAASLQEHNLGRDYYDAAVVEAVTLGLIDPKSDVAKKTLAALREHLTVGEGRGVFRNDEGGDYDKQEWIMLDLRLSEAERMAGLSGDDLWQWVTDKSAQNANLIAELYDARDASYTGSIPMVGFGAGAYLLAAHQRFSMVNAALPCGGYDNKLDEEEAPALKSESTPAAPVPTGCNAGSAFAFWPLLLVCLRPRYASRR